MIQLFVFFLSFIGSMDSITAAANESMFGKQLMKLDLRFRAASMRHCCCCSVETKNERRKRIRN